MKNLLRRLLGRTLARLLVLRSQTYPFPAGGALVLAPHADDETLGCGGLLAAKRARGDAVQVVFVSDSAGAPESGTSASLAARRRAEALAALDVLGIPPADIHFLEAADGRLNRLTPAETARVHTALTALLEKFKPAEIFVPYFGGGSTEHDATVDLAQAALATSGIRPRVWEYPVWAWWDPRRLAGQLQRPAENFHLKLAGLRDRKQAALACHRSQLEPQPPAGEPPLPPVLAALCTGPAEFYFHRQP
ncbi:MAG: PIG-L family deacetylase [Lacunisphaera sp.]|nr:PIG-L family deacetylase [Lacunisphaera sp.]